MRLATAGAAATSKAPYVASKVESRCARHHTLFAAPTRCPGDARRLVSQRLKKKRTRNRRAPLAHNVTLKSAQDGQSEPQHARGAASLWRHGLQPLFPASAGSSSAAASRSCTAHAVGVAQEREQDAPRSSLSAALLRCRRSSLTCELQATHTGATRATHAPLIVAGRCIRALEAGTGRVEHEEKSVLAFEAAAAAPLAPN